jgi:hypothetical protein
MNDLKDTIELMTSADYKERFKAEYWQTKIRFVKLHNMVIKYEGGTLNFEPTCNIKILKSQLEYMRNYLFILELRAEIERVNLWE